MPKIKVFANIYGDRGYGARIIGFDSESDCYDTASRIKRQIASTGVGTLPIALAVPLEIECEGHATPDFIPSGRVLEYVKESDFTDDAKRLEFLAFISAADAECDRLASISIFDLTDKMWRDFFDEGRDPKECAREALLDDGYPETLID